MCHTEHLHKYGEFNPGNLKTQSFLIQTGRDTFLKTASGVLVKVSANAFQSAPGKAITIQIKEILNKPDLIRSGIATLDKDGHLLESAGMVYLTTEPRIDIDPAHPIEISIPAKGLDPEMKVYGMDADNGAFLWTDQGQFKNAAMLNGLAEGRQLFMKNCAACHNPDLVSPMTGPALGCLERAPEPRTRKWLIEYTRNSQKMIAKEDLLARCIWDRWKPTLMSNFESLNNQEINEIYNYILNESLSRKLCEGNDSVYYTVLSDCFPKAGQAPGKYQALYDSLAPGAPWDTSVVYYPAYTLELKNYRWINCDQMLKPNGQVVKPFFVDIDGAESDVVEVYLIFKNKMALWPLAKSNGRYTLIESEFRNGGVILPLNEPVYILAFTPRWNGKRKYILNPTKVKLSNTYFLKLHDISEEDFQKMINRF
jgi:mono/diheme cytochrome c family protein